VVEVTIRNHAALASKAEGHVVTPSAGLGAFLVTSKSGNTYTVRPVVEGALSSAVCSCKWGQGKRGDCSHVLAVVGFASAVPEVK
jgi:hypothetical protein